MFERSYNSHMITDRFKIKVSMGGLMSFSLYEVKMT